MLQPLIPYIYSVSSTICFVWMQVLFKLLTQVLPLSTVLSTQSFSLLCLNSYILVSHKYYRQSYVKYQDWDPKIQQDSVPKIQQHLDPKIQQDVVSQAELQPDRRYEIHINDSHMFRLLLKRLCINCAGVSVMSMALQRVPLSLVNSLSNTAPIMIFFIEADFYQKPLNKIHLGFTFVSFVGVLIIVNPFSALQERSNEQLLSLLLPLTSAVLASFGFIFLHDLRGKINQFVMLEYTYISQVLLFNLLTNFAANDMLLLQASDHPPSHFQPSLKDPLFVGAFALSITLAYIANYCRVKSLFLLSPSKVIPLNYVGIVLSLLIDIYIFGHETNYVEIIGIFFTSVGLLSHLVIELIQNQKTKNGNEEKI